MSDDRSVLLVFNSNGNNKGVRNLHDYSSFCQISNIGSFLCPSCSTMSFFFTGGNTTFGNSN